MTSEKNRLYAGAARALAIAAGIGFGIARLTQPVLPGSRGRFAKAGTPKDSVVITAEGIRISKIGIAPAAAGELDAAISARATVDSTPDAEAVLTARGGDGHAHLQADRRSGACRRNDRFARKSRRLGNRRRPRRRGRARHARRATACA